MRIHDCGDNNFGLMLQFLFLCSTTRPKKNEGSSSSIKKNRQRSQKKAKHRMWWKLRKRKTHATISVLNRAHIFHFGQPGSMPSMDMNVPPHSFFAPRVIFTFRWGSAAYVSNVFAMKTIVIQYNEKYTLRKLMSVVCLRPHTDPLSFSIFQTV